MVKLNKIYTRTGDKGTSGLVGGTRRAKFDLRFEAIGTVDETNASLGRARLHTHASIDYDDMLKRIQHDLFDVGADLATPYDKAKKSEPLRIIAAQVTRLEDEIDALNALLAPLNSFVLPGGSQLAAELHTARTICRRAERIACYVATEEKINPVALQYLNRLSDFLFVLARVANNNGREDVLWQPGVNR